MHRRCGVTARNLRTAQRQRFCQDCYFAGEKVHLKDLAIRVSELKGF